MEVVLGLVSVALVALRLVRDLEPPRYSAQQLRYRGHNVNV